MADYKDITTSYSRQFSRPDDARREAENEQRKADLEAGANLEPDEMPTAQWNRAFDEEVAKYAAEDATTNGGQRVDEAIAGALTAAGERVRAAAMTSEQRMAKAIAAELRGQVLETGSGDLYVPTEDDIDREAELEAYLEAPDEDQWSALTQMAGRSSKTQTASSTSSPTTPRAGR